MRQKDSTPHTIDLLGLNAQQVWDTGRAYQHLSERGIADTRRTAERRLNALGLLPQALVPETLRDEMGGEPLQMVLQWEIEKARARRQLVLFAQLAPMPDGIECLHLNDGRGARYWVPLSSANPQQVINALQQIQVYLGKTISIFPHGRLIRLLRKSGEGSGLLINLLSYAPEPLFEPPTSKVSNCPAHLKRLVERSIYLLREVLANSSNPAILFGGGKACSVLLQLAKKASFPINPAISLLPISNTSEYRGLPELRKQLAQSYDMPLVEEIRQEEGMQQTQVPDQFDLLLSTRRREQNEQHQFDSLWNLYEEGKRRQEAIIVHPLADWTEYDLWHYIHLENLRVSSYYFASQRPVLERDGKLILIDSAPINLMPGEQIKSKCIRMASLSDHSEEYTIISTATNPAEILQELTKKLIHQPTLTERLR